MNATELIAEITGAFPVEDYPGDENIVYDNSDYHLEAKGIREAFKVYTWQQVPDELLLYEQSCLSFLSPAGYRYYLPAFLCFAVRDYWGADLIPDGIVFTLTWPVEDVAPGIDPCPLARQPLNIDSDSLLQDRPQTNAAIGRFIACAYLFSPAQGRAIYHFLAYLRDEYGSDFLHNEPEVAIRRYWFQFAEEAHTGQA